MARRRMLSGLFAWTAMAGVAIGLALVLPASDAGAQTLCSSLLNIEPDKGQNPLGGDVLEVGESVTFGVNILNGCKTGGVNVPAELSGTTTLQLTCATPSIPCAALLSGVLQVTSCVGSSNVACNVTDPANAVVELTFTDTCDFNPGGVCGTGNECKDVVAGPTTTSLATITATAIEPVLNFSGLFPGEFFAIASTPAGDLCSSAAAGSGQGSAPLYFPPVCEVEIDKTVSAGFIKDQGDTCNEETGQCRDDGSPCTDDDDCRIVGSATGWVGENVQYGIDVRNDGGESLVGCVVSDPNLGINTNIGNIAPGGVVPVEGLQPVLCQDHEGDNTATVTCECGESGGEASDSDTANLACLEPGLDVSKTCDDTDGNNASDTVHITAGNNGSADLVNCQVVDTLDLNQPSPPNTCSVLDGPEENVPVSPASFNLPGTITMPPSGSMQEVSGTFPELADDACNTVEVCCNIDNEEGGVVIDPTTGQPKLVCATDDAACAPERELLGCRITAGGITPDPPPDDPDPTTEPEGMAEIRKITFGGQVGASCGCIGCFDDLDHIQGQWTHVRHKRVGNFHASDYASLVCDLDDGEGPEPRPAPANKACFTGMGAMTARQGKREDPVVFRVEVEDRGEPGAGKNAGNQEDVYRIRIWNLEEGQDASELLDDICCQQADVAPGTPAPTIDDGGNLTHGNIQIHPVTPNTAKGICPVPRGVCTEF